MSTVTVQTVDHGPVVLPEPSWCAISHPDGVYRADIHHQGVEAPAFIDVSGRGRIQFLTAFLSQYPYSVYGSRSVSVAVEIEGEHYEFDSDGLGDLASVIATHVLCGLLPLQARLQSLGE